MREAGRNQGGVAKGTRMISTRLFVYMADGVVVPLVVMEWPVVKLGSLSVGPRGRGREVVDLNSARLVVVGKRLRFQLAATR